VRVENCFSSAYVQHHDRLAKSGIRSKRFAGPIRHGSVKARRQATCGNDCQNVVYNLQGKNQVNSLGCRVWGKEKRQKFDPSYDEQASFNSVRGVGWLIVIDKPEPGFASHLNTGAYKVLVKTFGQILISNHIEFKDNIFQFLK
jgi:hypothetical protein